MSGLYKFKHSFFVIPLAIIAIHALMIRIEALQQHKKKSARDEFDGFAQESLAAHSGLHWLGMETAGTRQSQAVVA